MPYFQRKPYAEMIAGAVPAPCPETEALSQPPFLDRAATILKEESTQLPNHSAPTHTMPPGCTMPTLSEPRTSVSGAFPPALGMPPGCTMPTLSEPRTSVSGAYSPTQGIPPKLYTPSLAEPRTLESGAFPDTGAFPVPPAVPPNIPTLQPKSPARPGQTANLVITIHNDSTSAASCTASATDLVSVSGARIGSGQVRFSPREASVPPGASADVKIAIDIPLGTAPGQYAGLLVVESVHAILTVKVIS